MKGFRAEFHGTTNKKDEGYIWVNTIMVQMPDGREFVIDRDATYYDVEDGEFDMEWRGLYIWSEDGANYDLPEDIVEAKLVSVDIEDDAPAGYEMKVEAFEIC